MAGSTSKAAAVTKPAAKSKAAPKVARFGPRRFRLEAETGALELVGPDGSRWSPLACGEHRSVPVAERASDEGPGGAEGFQPKCDACVEQAETAAAHALQHSTV